MAFVVRVPRRGRVERSRGPARTRPFWGRGGARRLVPTLLGAGFLGLVCCGCETTVEHSAELEKRAKHEKLALQGVSVTRESPSVQVLQSVVVGSREGTAVVVELRNTSAHALENAPIEITVRDAKGGVVFQNNQPGADPSLTRVSLLEPGKKTLWVDDQVQASGVGASAGALVGEATRTSGSLPQMSVVGMHLSDEGGEAGAVGNVTNRSRVNQQHLVVYAVARKGARIVAAGRAVLPEVAPAGSVAFQAYFVGDPRGAQLQTSAPATTF
jgi:hypothetical protein